MTTKIDYLISEIESTIGRARSVEHPKVKELYLHEADGMVRALNIFVGKDDDTHPHRIKSNELSSKVLDLLYPENKT